MLPAGDMVGATASLLAVQLCSPVVGGSAEGRTHRARLDEGHSDRIAQAEDLRVIGAVYEGGMTRLALHWSLTPPAVSAIIPGARTVEQIEENVRASNGCVVSPSLRAEIERICAGW